MTEEQIITSLKLQPHPKEGGFFCESYRSDETVSRGALPGRYSTNRTFGTAIYYLLTPDTFSAMHRLQSDEVFHFYLGGPVEMLQLFDDGSGRVITLGADILSGMRPQVVVPRMVWQGARLKAGGHFALLGCTVSPGFEYTDYQSGERPALAQDYPEFREMIEALTV